MPYRRLPNTDHARIRALKMAIEKAKKSDYFEMVISAPLVKEAEEVFLRFEALLKNHKEAYEIQVKANRSFQIKVQNMRTYLSHFVQVLYMCVCRSEISSDHLKLYGLENEKMLLPDCSTNEQLLKWGSKIIDGEKKRLTLGGVPIYNPSIAKVNVMFSLFSDGYRTQKMHQKATARLLNNIVEYRKVVDKVIFDIWEEVESYHLSLPLTDRYEKNRQYGVVYYYRKGEKEPVK